MLGVGEDVWGKLPRLGWSNSEKQATAEFPTGAGGGCPWWSSAQGHVPAQSCFLPIPVLLALIIFWFLLGVLPNKLLSHEASSRRLFLETVTGERQEARGPEGDGPWLEDNL